MPRAGWAALDAELPDDGLAEWAIAAVADTCLGLEELRSTSGGRLLRVYFDDAAAAREAAERLRQPLGPAASPSRIRLRVRSVADRRWAERYQARLHPFPLGAGFTVYPAGRPARPVAGRRPILLVPGRAFGTGEHATTRMCAELVERHAAGGGCWLDLGTGSGILAVVAALAGAARVLAVDSDPTALQVAREVLEANGVADRVELRQGSIECAADRTWSAIVANVDTAFFEQESATLVRLLRPQGTLIVSGIPDERAASVAAGLAARGVGAVERHSRGGWSALVHRRPR